MNNIISYLNEYGKYGFEEKPFNEVDNACICQMFYADFDDYFKLRKSYTLKELAALLFFDHDEKELKKSKSLIASAPFVLKAMAKSNRFKDTVLTNFKLIDDETKDELFCAGELILNEKTSYIVYRGTKDTVTSWKESFSLIYKKTASHIDADKYLRKTIKDDRKYYIGGHSKGGTIAIYAALMNPQCHNNIIKVYSNDGPGLNPKILPENYHDNFKTLQGKYVKIIPEFDIFGTIFSSSRKKRIIKSNAIALKQHDIMLWVVDKNKFVDGKPLKRVDVLRKAFEDYANTVTDEEFELFLNNYENLLKKHGINKIDGGFNGMLPFIVTSLSSVPSMSDNSKKVTTNLIKLVIKENHLIDNSTSA